MVTVSRSGEAQEYDLELAPDVPVKDLAAAIIKALGWALQDDPSTKYTIELYPPGCVLQPDDTLAQAQAWDGSRLYFVAAGTTEPIREAAEPGPDGPVERWEPFPS